MRSGSFGEGLELHHRDSEDEERWVISHDHHAPRSVLLPALALLSTTHYDAGTGSHGFALTTTAGAWGRR